MADVLNNEWAPGVFDDINESSSSSDGDEPLSNLIPLNFHGTFFFWWAFLYFYKLEAKVNRFGAPRV